MNDNSNTITFKYIYPEGATDLEKYEIDNSILDKVNKAFWESYNEGHITNFYLIDEEME